MDVYALHLRELWLRQRRTLVFAALALTLGVLAGAFSALIIARPAPVGSRSTFYAELYLAGVVAIVILTLTMSKAQLGLPVLLCVLAFLPSRTGMQWRLTGFVTVSASDLTLLLGVIVLFLRTKIARKGRLQPIVIRTPLWIWLLVGALGLLVSVARGVPWQDVVPDLKGFYLWILTVLLCVNVLRTPRSIRLIMLVTVLSAVPRVFLEIKDAVTGANGVTTLLANGVVVARTSGGAGLINSFAFYIMVVFFLALALGITSRHWASRTFYYGCVLFFFIGLGFTYTRGAWLATTLGILVLALSGGRKVFFGILIACVIAYFLIPPTIWARLNFSDNSIAERVSFTQTALATIRAYPLLGGGWGSGFYLVGQMVVPSFKPNEVPFWHNDYLIVATQVGLAGLAVFLWIWAALMRAMLRAWRLAPRGPLRVYLLVLMSALVAMMTQPLTDMFFWRDETGPLIWLVVGLICAIINLGDENQRAVQAMPVPPTTPAPRSEPHMESLTA